MNIEAINSDFRMHLIRRRFANGLLVVEAIVIAVWIIESVFQWI